MIIFTLSAENAMIGILSILVGLFFVIYQIISWRRYDLIRKLAIWWNQNVFQRHKEPYYGPSERMEKLSHVYGILLFFVGLFMIVIGVGIFIV